MDQPPTINEEEIFQRVSGLAPGERSAYLDAICGDDLALRARMERLLVADNDRSFMEVAAPDQNSRINAQIESLKPEESGERIGPYKLREQIGEGGFGAVWVADQETPVKRRVALKVIKMGMDTKEVIARFEQERQALALMDHPNIAKVLDAGATQYGRPYFVMELVRGITITDYCDQANLSTADRLQLFVSICHAVQHAHQKGIIHRDLKPSNILVTMHDGSPVPKVIDFGVAKATQGRLANATIYTQFQQMIGTPLYMSPEQAEMSGLDVDTRSDIYSLGVLLYELLTGRTPVSSETLARLGLDEIRRIIREQEPPRPSTVLRTMPPPARTTVAHHRHVEAPKLISLLRGDLDWIVMKALEKDRTRRYETANGLAMDIKRHIANEPVLARPAGPMYRFRRLVRRNKGAFVAAAAVTIALLVGIALSLWQAVRANRALAELRASAPAFAEQARALAAKERFDEAIEKLTYAAKLRPDSAEYLLEKGDLLEAQLRLSEAAAAYRAALKLIPGDPRALANAALCERLHQSESDGKKLSHESMSELLVAMQSERRPATQLMPLARRLGAEKSILLAYWLARFKELPVAPEKTLEQRLTMRDDGLLSLDLSNCKLPDLNILKDMPLGALDCTDCDQLADISALRGMLLKSLSIQGTKVASLEPLDGVRTLEALWIGNAGISNLSPLRDARLKALYAVNCPIADLSPLKGMPLATLRVDSSKVVDLQPLVGMPLKMLGLGGVPVDDFTPLRGLPVKTLFLSRTKIRDLDVLREMPLQTLFLTQCREARNFQALTGLRTLEVLTLPEDYRNLPQTDLAAISELRKLPLLRQVTENPKVGVYISEIGSADSFWKQWDRETSVFQSYRAQGFKFGFKVLADGTWDVSFRDQAITNLSPLRGAPISHLDLRFTKVTDLGPLSGMPLISLELERGIVADLTPLRGLPLQYLQLGGCPVSDLSPLTGMPLEKLYLGVDLVSSDRHGTNVSDLRPLGSLQQLRELALDGTQEPDVSPLVSCAKLERIILPPKVKNLEALRQLPSLKGLSWGYPGSWDKLTPVAKFWEEGIPASEETLVHDRKFAELVKLMRRRIDDRSPDSRLRWLNLGVAAAAQGNLLEYRKICADILAKYKDSGDPMKVEAAVKVCLLLPESGIDLATLAERLAGFAIDENNSHLPWHLGTQGLAAYRAHKWAEAVALLSRVKDNEVAETVAAPIMAMARFQLHSSDAPSELERARRLIAPHWSDSVSEFNQWRDWLTAHLLLQEAERLFGNAPQETKK